MSPAASGGGLFREAWVGKLWLGVLLLGPLGFLLDLSLLASNGQPRAAVEERPAAVLTSDQLRFLEKEYDAAVAEINQRNDQEYLLYYLKLTSLGAVIAFVFDFYRKRGDLEEQGTDEAERFLQRSAGSAIGCWTAVAVGALLDGRLELNSHFLRLRGAWVASVEEHLLPERVQGWEHFLAGSDAFSSLAAPLVFASRPLLTWLLFAVTFLVFVPRDGGPTAPALLRVARWALPLIFFLFGLVGVQYYTAGSAFALYATAVTAGALLAVAWVRRLQTDLEARVEA